MADEFSSIDRMNCRLHCVRTGSGPDIAVAIPYLVLAGEYDSLRPPSRRSVQTARIAAFIAKGLA